MKLFASIITMTMLGSVYTWSVFRLHIENTFSVQTTTSGLPYMTSLFFYALAMMVTGRKLNSNNLLKIHIFGILLVGSGWIFSGYASSLLELTFTYGVLMGSGVGVLYGIPLLVMQKTYPEKSGLMSGLVLMGFGMSALFTAPLFSWLINTRGLMVSFRIIGISFLVILLLVAPFLRLRRATATMPHIATAKYNSLWFVQLYLLFFLATTIGLTVIGITYGIGVDAYGYSTTTMTAFMALFAIMNGIARPFFGLLVDKKGFGFAAYTSLGLIAAAALLSYFNHGVSLFIFAVSFAILWLNLGAWLAIAPSAVKEKVGAEHFARMYGTLFTAYGLGALAGVYISGVLIDTTGDFSSLYSFILVTVLLAFGILFKKGDAGLRLKKT